MLYLIAFIFGALGGTVVSILYARKAYGEALSLAHDAFATYHKAIINVEAYYGGLLTRAEQTVADVKKAL